MCFSATASFVAGGALSASGLVTIKQTKEKRALPLASIPLLFGIQQLIEGMIWLSFATPWLNLSMTFIYSLFSHVFWPFFLPLAVWLVEKNPRTKKILFFFFLLGLAVSLYILTFILKDGISAQVVNYCIAYKSPHLYQGATLIFYVLATCGSCLLSSHKIINVFGLVMLTSLVLTAWFFIQNLVSVWCFFVAILSWLIYLQMRTTNRKGSKR